MASPGPVQDSWTLLEWVVATMGTSYAASSALFMYQIGRLQKQVEAIMQQFRDIAKEGDDGLWKEFTAAKTKQDEFREKVLVELAHSVKREDLVREVDRLSGKFDRLADAVNRVATQHNHEEHERRMSSRDPQQQPGED